MGFDFSAFRQNLRYNMLNKIMTFVFAALVVATFSLFYFYSQTGLSIDAIAGVVCLVLAIIVQLGGQAGLYE